MTESITVAPSSTVAALRDDRTGDARAGRDRHVGVQHRIVEHLSLGADRGALPHRHPPAEVGQDEDRGAVRDPSAA